MKKENKKSNWIIDVLTFGAVIYGVYWAVKAFML